MSGMIGNELLERSILGQDLLNSTVLSDRKFCNLFPGILSAGGGIGVSIVEIGASAMYNGTNQYLSRSLSGAGTSQKTFTIGGWCDRANRDGTQKIIFAWDNGSDNVDRGFIAFDDTVVDGIRILMEDTSNVVTVNWVTNRLFRNIGAFHWCLTVDTTPVTPIFKLFINNEEITNWTKDIDTLVQDDTFAIADNSARHAWGAAPEGATYGDFYLSECFYQDGQVVTDATDYVDVSDDGNYVTPKEDLSGLTFGTHGEYLNNLTNPETNAAGTGNFTNNNSVSLSDNTPTNNFSMWSPFDTQYLTTAFNLSNGNTGLSEAANAFIRSTISIPDGDWYSEHQMTTDSSGGSIGFGVASFVQQDDAGADSLDDFWLWGPYYAGNDRLYDDGVRTTNYYNSAGEPRVGDVIGVAIKRSGTSYRVWWSINGTFIDGDPTTDTSPTVTFTSSLSVVFATRWHSTSGTRVSSSNFGQDAFSNQPTDFLALNTTNIHAINPTTYNIDDHYYQEANISHTNGVPTAITLPFNINTTGGMVRVKRTDSTGDWIVLDTVRGDTAYSKWNDAFIEDTFSDGGFSTDTFTMSGDFATGTYIIEAFAVGIYFQIKTWTGTTAAQTITWATALDTETGFHTVIPRSAATSPIAWHKSLTSDEYTLFLDGTGVELDRNNFSAHTVTGCTAQADASATDINTNGATYVSYGWASVGPYRFEKYIGNGNTDGPYFDIDGLFGSLTTKRINIADNWNFINEELDPYNDGTDETLFCNLVNALAPLTDRQRDHLSRGPKVRNTDPEVNANNGEYVISAFGIIPHINVEGRILAAK